MSHTVLARKYRPRNFEGMVGQEHVVRALANALTSQRLHHAYLFTGTRGVGKTTVARILAKSLNCSGADGAGGITAQPCGACAACRDIDAGRFIDYTELDAASNRGVDEISQLLEQSAYKPVLGRFKVFMIDEVHMLSSTAFNAMLKTLEEPPAYLKFVLATTDPQKVPVTVLSRCLQFNLRPMAPQTVLAHLRHVLAGEAIDAEPGALRLLARGAHGSMRDALSLTDQAIAYGAGSVTEDGVRQMLGAVGRLHVYALLDALAAGDGAAVVATADALRAQGLSAEGALEEMAVVLQELAVLQAVPAQREALDDSDPEAAALAARVGLLPPDETQLLYSIALHGRAELALAPDDYSGLVMVLLRMLAFRPRSAATSALPVGAPATSAPLAAPLTNPPPTSAPRTSALPMSVPATNAPGTSGPATHAARAKSVTPAQAAPRAVPATAPLMRAPHVASAVVSTSILRSDARAEPRAAAADSTPPWDDEVPFEDEPARHVAEPPPPPFVVAPTRADRAAATSVDTSVDTSVATGAEATPARSAPIAPIAPTTLGDRWAVLVRQLTEVNAVAALVRELALQSECTAIDDGEHRFALRVERDSLRQPAHADKLQAALGALLGHAVRIDVQAGTVDDTPARRELAARAQRQADAEALIHADPLVRHLTERYRTARIVPGSIKPV